MSFDSKLWELIPKSGPVWQASWFSPTQPECHGRTWSNLILQICDPQPSRSQGTASWKTIFPRIERWEMVSGWLKHITFIAYSISLIITWTVPQIVRHQILEAGDPLLQIKGVDHRKGYCRWRMQCPPQEGLKEHRSKATVTSEQDPGRPSGPILTIPGARLIPGVLSGL